MKQSRILAVSLVLAFLLPAVSGPKAETIETDHFVVTFEDVGRYYAGIVAKSAERQYTNVVRTLGHEPSSPITIIIAADEKRFMALTREVLPDWSAAAALPGNRIVISPLKGRKIDVERIVAHETVHCVINDASGGRYVPRWFHEGCAETVAGGLGIRGRAYIVWKVLSDDIMSFTDIERVFSRGAQDAGLAYDQSLIAVGYLMKIHGKDVLGAILSGMRDGLEFDAAFERATGVAPKMFETVCAVHIKKTYGWRAVVTVVPGTWTGILILAFIVYAVKKYRTRKILKEWETMEKPGNIIDFSSFPPDDD